MAARIATAEPTATVYQQIQYELQDWDWRETGGRPATRLSGDTARSILVDLKAGINKSAIVRKYGYRFSRRWLKRAY